MNAIAELEAVAAKAPAGEMVEARVVTRGSLTDAVAHAIELCPSRNHDEVLRRVVSRPSQELGCADPIADAEIDAEIAEEEYAAAHKAMESVRAAVKQGDTEHALLLIHREIGGY